MEWFIVPRNIAEMLIFSHLPGTFLFLPFCDTVTMTFFFGLGTKEINFSKCCAMLSAILPYFVTDKPKHLCLCAITTTSIIFVNMIT